jgi:predicted O-linked N-acetylglucosamine transferase (SPINDLY family)
MDAPLANMLAGIQQRLAAGRYDEAESAARAAQKRAPRDANVLQLLGVACFQQGKRDEAIQALRKAAMLAPGHAGVQSNLGTAYAALGDYARSVEHHRRAVQLDPSRAEYFSNLGDSLRQVGQFEDAAAACRRALAIHPASPAALNNLAAALWSLGRIGEGLAAARQAVAAAPDDPAAWTTLLSLLESAGLQDESIAACRRLVELDPTSTAFPLGVTYSSSVAPEEMFAEHRRWATRLADPLAPPARASYPNDPDPDRRLRIGYVSPDFRDHAVAYFFEPVLEHHDRGQVEVFVYSASPAAADAVTNRLRGYDAQWRDIATRSDADAADVIRRDGIDILVDLALHTRGSRLLLFARKPAPVQATWLAYAGTSGLKTIDWRVTDAIIDPPGLTESLHTERLLRLPRTQWVYRPPADTPEVAPPPATASGVVTFGWAGTIMKLTPRTIELWANVLRDVEGSRLRLMAATLDEPAARMRLLEQFAKHGVDGGDGGGGGGDRIELRGAGTTREYLEFFAAIDIMLDTFPFTGGTTACHSLWMGVPVVTLTGPTSVSRVAASVLRNVGLNELVAETPEQFTRAAGELAADVQKLSTLRATLRERLDASPLRDEAGFTRELEAGFRTMWQAWCAQQRGPRVEHLHAASDKAG